MKRLISLFFVVVVLTMFSVKTFADMVSAGALMTAKNYSGARVAFAVVVAENGPDATFAQWNIGQSYELEKNYIAAREAYIKAITMPDLYTATAAQYSVGYCYALEKNYEQARAEYVKATTMLSPEYKAAAQWEIGNCYKAEGNIVNSQVAYGKVLLIKSAPVGTLIAAIGAIDFVSMTQSDADTLLVKAYRTITDKQAKAIDKDGKEYYIYTEYLSALLANMSQTAQANFVK